MVAGADGGTEGWTEYLSRPRDLSGGPVVHVRGGVPARLVNDRASGGALVVVGNRTVFVRPADLDIPGCASCGTDCDW